VNPGEVLRTSPGKDLGMRAFRAHAHSALARANCFRSRSVSVPLSRALDETLL
jgi:hypothetical protein